MILILDGSSEHGAHIWSKSGILVCGRHLVTSKEKTYFTFYGRYHFIYRYHEVLFLSLHLMDDKLDDCVLRAHGTYIRW